MRLLFLSDNFPPEVNAPATRTYEHCSEWVKDGFEVTVITCAPNFPEGKVYSGYKNSWKKEEWVNGIRVIRVWSYITANEGFFKRILDYISYSITAFLAGLFIKCDIIIATSPQFFTALAGQALAFWKTKPWIMEVRDLWPESIKTVGAINDGFVYHFLEWLELRLYRSATKIVTVTETFKKSIVVRGIDGDKIEVIKNGANLILFTPRERNQTIINELKLSGKFVISFIGTIGLAHKLSFILESASKIKDSSIHFLIVGSGAEKRNLEYLVQSLKLTNITILDKVAKELVPEYLSVSDVCLINLKRSETFKTVIPSKIFESSAMAKPILLGVDGEAREILESYSAGLFFEPENEQDLIEKIYLLKNNHVLYEQCKTGCLKLAKDFDRKKLAAKMSVLFRGLASTKQ
ncbi:MAG: glycosyltransferase family 4 protein [Bacteroidales bacterium]|jgi:glycosyltransferase involved in cell wall biosynthesis